MCPTGAPAQAGSPDLAELTLRVREAERENAEGRPARARRRLLPVLRALDAVPDGDPDVVRVRAWALMELARSEFSYIENCPAKVDIVMGDARLTMEQEIARGESQQFDLLALDAFSSDAIPVHLLTREAFALYLKQVKPGGVIAVHVSNRYLHLRPVVEKLAEHFGMTAATIYNDNDPNWWIYATSWILVSKNRDFLAQPAIADVTEEPEKRPKPAPLWTDDYASLYSILK